MNPDLAIIGLNHRSAPLALRERFAFSPEAHEQMLESCSREVDEIVLLCTCNRTEWIFGGGNDAKAKLTQTITQTGKLADGQFDEHFYYREADEALLHLARVAAGLDSMVMGETQVFGQVKDAFETSLGQGLAKENFGRIYQRLLHLAKAARSQTDIGKGAVSVSSMAVQLVRQVFDDLGSKTVTLVGAGEMCEKAAELFAAANVAAIHVVNRSPERAQRLASSLGGQAHELTELEEVLANADIALSSTASPEPIITAAAVRRLMRQRPRRPLFIIDIAVPRDVEPAVNEIDEVYLYNIDDLQSLVDRNLAARQQEAVRAEELLKQKLLDFKAGDREEIGPLITSLKQRADEMKAAELTRLFRRHSEWSETEREDLGRSIDLIVNRILHDPIISLRKGLGDETDTPPSLTELFKRFFNL